MKINLDVKKTSKYENDEKVEIKSRKPKKRDRQAEIDAHSWIEKELKDLRKLIEDQAKEIDKLKKK